MANRSRFGGRYVALDYNFGGAGNDTPPALQVYQVAPSAVGSATLTLAYGQVTATDGTVFSPLNTNNPLTVGTGSNAETVTLTAISNPTPGTLGTAQITATFDNAHGTGDFVTSSTYGLQEAINVAAASGGGIVVVTAPWYSRGGTAAIVSAATLPSGGTVRVEDNSAASSVGISNRSGSVSLLAAPSIPLITQVASTAATGTWTAVTTYVKFAYVNAAGGITIPSSEYSFTATVSKAIGGTGPIAATGAVGYLVFIGTTTNVNYQVPCTAANGTTVQCGAITAFLIGTSFSSPTITTVATALPPTTSNAFTGIASLPVASPNMVQPFQTVFPPFANITTVTAGTAQEWARVDLPAGFLNNIGRTLRITLIASFTPGSTATLIPTLLLESVYGTTTTAMWTVTTAATSGTTQSNLIIEMWLCTAATGAAGTIEAHGRMTYQSASGSPPAALAVIDSVTAASGAANLVTQDTLSFQINSGTANLTSARVRFLMIEVMQ
jgi:hypothetical protein